MQIRDQKIIDVQSNLDLVNLLEALLKAVELNGRFLGELVKVAVYAPIRCAGRC
ncbi:MAG: hypothetical protein ACRED0_10265 [Gammaproteobacteria bacterium]